MMGDTDNLSFLSMGTVLDPSSRILRLRSVMGDIDVESAVTGDGFDCLWAF